MKLLALLALISTSALAQPSEEEIKAAQQICQFKGMIAATTQQARIDYLAKEGTYQSWETFFHYCLEQMNLKHDEGLKNALDISKHVFFDYATETNPDDVLAGEFNGCWQEFVQANSGVEL